MTSTEGVMHQSKLRRFLDRMIPLVERTYEGKEAFFDLRPSLSGNTYFSNRIHQTMRRSDFELPDCDSAGSLEEYLAKVLSHQGSPQLVDLAKEIVQVAKDLKGQETAEAEVSPFIYVMW